MCKRDLEKIRWNGDGRKEEKNGKEWVMDSDYKDRGGMFGKWVMDGVAKRSKGDGGVKNKARTAWVSDILIIGVSVFSTCILEGGGLASLSESVD